MKQNQLARKSDAEDANGILLKRVDETDEQKLLVVSMKRADGEEQAKDEANADEVKPTEQTTIEASKQPLSIEEIKRRNEILRRLTAKYDVLQEKRQRVENFEISHDQDTASVTVSDATGEVFESNSPKTIGKLIEFWKEEFSTALIELEKEIRQNA